MRISGLFPDVPGYRSDFAHPSQVAENAAIAWQIRTKQPKSLLIVITKLTIVILNPVVKGIFKHSEELHEGK